MLELDHFAVVAETLEEAQEWLEDTLGVPLQPGGQHAYFGTHNMLLGLEGGLYLEAIAIDPNAMAPGYSRWFDLDRVQGDARPGNWICRTKNLDQMITHFPQAGAPVPLMRGDLRWKMAVPEDGILPYDNCFPAIMHWQGSKHPAEILTPSGCRLEYLIISHPMASELQAMLAPVLRDTRVVFEVGTAAIRAEIMTPSGTKVLA